LNSLSIADGLTVSINTTVKIAEVDTTFLSVALDADEIAKDLKQVPFSSPKFLALCEGLSKLNINRPMLYLRIGGTKGDDIIFQWTGLDISSEKYVMNSTEWDEINLFAMKMQWKFIFGLNALERKRDGSWDPTNFIMLMRYTSTKGYLVNYELGNEPDLYLGHRNISIPPAQLARDFSLLKVVIAQESASVPNVFGPDVATLDRDNYFSKYLTNIEQGVLNAVTFHHYYGASKNATAADFINPAYLDKFLSYASKAKTMIKKGVTKDTPIWAGETSSTYGGGAMGLSDRFAAGFLWLDKLGLAARLGISVVIRQSLLGGHYSLIDSDLNPNPDYWLSVLYKQLVGYRVLNVTGSLNPMRQSRIYAHCINSYGSHKYPDGDVVIIAINLDPRNNLLFNMEDPLSKLKADAFILQPVGDITSKQVLLNGQVLEMVDDKTLPAFNSKEVTQPFSLPSLTFGFFVLKGANAKACL